MDTTDPQIVFDEFGRCNNCTHFISILERFGFGEGSSEEKVDRLFDKVRESGHGKQYDCVLGMSGGIDSSYAAYLCKKHGLRPLAVHMDNGWDTEESVINIRKIVSKLEIDYTSFVLDWAEFRDIQLAFLKASVPEAETPTDVAILGILHRVAAKHGIKYIVSAGNIATEGLLPKSWHYNAKDLKYFLHIRKRFGRQPLNGFPTFDFKSEAYYKIVRGIRFVYPLNDAGISEEQMESDLAETFGFRSYGAKHHESRYTRFIQSFYLFKKFGIDYRRATFSAKICSGQASRSEALEVLETLPYDMEQVALDKQYVAKKLEIGPEELDTIINLPPKWYWDFPNDDRKLKKLYAAYRRFFGS